ncbi:MAG: helix-turn-helix domain-containing protein [Rhodospirillales bacterium]|nr:helix-turn-helix domain-containing protein [Rhodospirillales bacterium]
MNEALQITAGVTPDNIDLHKLKTLADFEKEYIELVIKLCKGNIVHASEILAVSPSTIYRKRNTWDQA